MAVRKCPYCLAVVTAGRTTAFSNDLECPGCHRPLEISPISRYISVWAGLAAGAAVWYWATRSGNGDESLGWALPVVYAFLAFSIVAPLILMLTGDLRLKSADAASQASVRGVDAGHAASGSHH
jgi:hypothetical protein